MAQALTICFWLSFVVLLSVKFGNFCLLFADLQSVKVYRDLSKPVGALNENRLQKLLVSLCFELFFVMSSPKDVFSAHATALTAQSHIHAGNTVRIRPE